MLPAGKGFRTLFVLFCFVCLHFRNFPHGIHTDVTIEIIFKAFKREDAES